MRHPENIHAVLIPFLVVLSVAAWLVCSITWRTRRRRETEAAATMQHYHARTATQRLSDEPINNDHEAIKVVHLLEAIAARVEVGIDRDFYTQCLANAWAESKRLLETSTYPGFCYFAKSAFDSYRRALDIWRTKIGSAVTFIGGGFGLEGALEGMAVATVLNAVVSSASNAKARKIQDQIRAEWHDASERIAVLRSVL
jgi:hypothetical protein